MKEVSLVVEDEVFKINKDDLCEYSDYFRAMFSGNYVENKQSEIRISVVDANSMKIIAKYMENGLVDLSELPLTTMGELAVSANFLQMTELIKQIEITLELQLTLDNWMATKYIAEISSLITLEKAAATFGLLSFKNMTPDCIPSIEKLHWYLSHPYLNADNEYNVFKFGHQWIKNSMLSADAMLMLLGCLDINALTLHNLKDMQKLMHDNDNSLAAKVVNTLLEMTSRGWELSSDVVVENRASLCELFTQSVYNEVLQLVKKSMRRLLTFVPCVSVSLTTECRADRGPQFLYTFMEQVGFDKWLEVAEKVLWGWSVTSWGPTKLVVVGGEFGRGTGFFMRQVAVWNTLKKEWTRHGVELPPRRHAGVVVIGNELYIVGGVGTFRVVLGSTIVYNLEERSYRKLKDLPDVIQNPPVCAHNGELYVGGQKHIYKFKDTEDYWDKVLDTDIRASYLVSLEEYIYVTQNYFSHLFRFRPGADDKLDMFANFSNPVAAMCSLGKRIIAFTQTVCGANEILSVEEFQHGGINVLWSEQQSSIQINDVAGCCALLLSEPPVKSMVSEYSKLYLSRFKET